MLSWEKITYMGSWPPQRGSPFSRGTMGNLSALFCSEADNDIYTSWHLPMSPPANGNDACCFVGCRAFWRRLYAAH